ncbi:MAG: hypothetical protein LZ168_04470 [Thaumarchaeota archaeon]|jgi:hypothetical protein|nr:hypothetical protein [Candidatus Geocrenenecus arthurdayi]
MPIPEVLEKIVEKIKQATGMPVKTSWISSSDLIPLITVIQNGGSSEPLASTSLQQRLYEFQVDVWAKSAKQRDEIAEKILSEFTSKSSENYLQYGWFSVRFYRILDIEEEGVYRKSMILVLKEVT